MSGRLAMDVYLRGRGESRDELTHSLVGQGSVSLDPIELQGTPLIAEIQKVVDLPAREKAGSLRTDFRLQDGRVTTERLTLTMGRVPLVASGWTSFDGQLDYQVKLDGSSVRLPEKARRLMNDLDLDPNALSSFRLSGSVDRVVVKSNAADALGPLPDRPIDPPRGPGAAQDARPTIPRQAAAVKCGLRKPEAGYLGKQQALIGRAFQPDSRYCRPLRAQPSSPA